MVNRRSLYRNTDKSTKGSSRNASTNHELLGVDHDQTPYSHTLSLDIGLLSVRVILKEVSFLSKMYILRSA